jgi:hypothetical protein
LTVRYNNDKKFDLQLSQALIHERRLGEIFRTGVIELKTETHQWEETGNIFIEYSHNGEPSGLAVTEAEYWMHELRRKGHTLVYLMFPIERLRRLAKVAYRQGLYRELCGDGDRTKGVLIPLKWLRIDKATPGRAG